MFRSLKNKLLIGSLAVILTTTIGATFCYLISESETIVNLFKPFLNPYGNLKIEKYIEHPFGEDYVVPEGMVFDFEVDLGEENANQEFETSTGKAVKADADGVIALKVRSDIPVTIKDIPTDTEVSVTEVQNKDGFKVKGGQDSQNITILSQETKTAQFTNIYTPDKVKDPQDVIEIQAVKKLAGRKWLATDAFIFELKVKTFDEEKEKDVWKLIGTETVTDSTGFGFEEAIADFEFNEAKTYSFRIDEVEGDIKGIQYSKETVYFDVVVGDADMDGVYEIQGIENPVNAVVETDREKDIITLEAEFVNTYTTTEEERVSVVLEFYKKFQDGWKNELDPSGFTIGLYSEKDELMYTSTPTTAAGEAKIDLGYFDKDDVGKVYTYQAKEIYDEETENGVIFDDSEYQVTVRIVEDADGTLKAVVNGDKKTYVNIYNPENTTAIIEGTKLYKDNELKPEQFSFALYEADDSFQVAKNAKALAVEKNQEDGSFSFETAEYEKTGVYRYVVKEEIEEPVSYIKYDQTKYYVTVNVSDIDGKLVSEVQYMDEYGEQKDIQFVNEYKPAPVYVTLEGTKFLENKELTEGMFSFELYEEDDVCQTSTNDAAGKFVFEELSFTEAGEFDYQVKEQVSSPQEYMEYDKTLYNVKVIVTDDKEGNLSAKVTITTEDGKEQDEIVFVNKYTKPGEEPDDPDKPDEPGGSDKPDGPDKPGDKPSGGGTGTKTGDAANIFLYLTIFFGSGAVILAIYLFVVRKRKEV